MTNWYESMIMRHEDLACELEDLYRRECEDRAEIEKIISEVWTDPETGIDYEREESIVDALLGDDWDDDELLDGEF